LWWEEFWQYKFTQSHVSKGRSDFQQNAVHTRVRQTEKSFNITSKSTYFCPKGQALLQKKFNLKAITTSSTIEVFRLPTALPQGQLAEVPLYFEIFTIKVGG